MGRAIEYSLDQATVALMPPRPTLEALQAICRISGSKAAIDTAMAGGWTDREIWDVIHLFPGVLLSPPPVLVDLRKRVDWTESEDPWGKEA